MDIKVKNFNGNCYHLSVEIDLPILGKSNFSRNYYQTTEIAATKRFKEYVKRMVRVTYDEKKIELYRNPTEGEIKFGHGATHYKDFWVSEVINYKTFKLKQWVKCPYDGLRYYRSIN